MPLLVDGGMIILSVKRWGTQGAKVSTRNRIFGNVEMRIQRRNSRRDQWGESHLAYLVKIGNASLGGMLLTSFSFTCIWYLSNMACC